MIWARFSVVRRFILTIMLEASDGTAPGSQLPGLFGHMLGIHSGTCR
jgi:hypothetical protein